MESVLKVCLGVPTISTLLLGLSDQYHILAWVPLAGVFLQWLGLKKFSSSVPIEMRHLSEEEAPEHFLHTSYYLQQQQQQQQHQQSEHDSATNATEANAQLGVQIEEGGASHQSPDSVSETSTSSSSSPYLNLPKTLPDTMAIQFRSNMLLPSTTFTRLVPLSAVEIMDAKDDDDDKGDAGGGGGGRRKKQGDGAMDGQVMVKYTNEKNEAMKHVVSSQAFVPDLVYVQDLIKYVQHKEQEKC